MKHTLMIIAIVTMVLISGCSPQATITVPTPSGGWVESPQNPLLKEGSLAGWMALKADPVVIKDGDLYKMWFTGAGNDIIQIGYATCENGVDWDVYPEPVFERGEPGSWDEHGVETAFVMKDGDTYKLWYSGQTTEDVKEMIAAGLGGRNILPAIGYATSEDGINWTRHGDKPVIGQRTDILWHGEQDRFVGFSDPHVIKEEGIYKMWFQGNGSGPYADLHEIGYATSQDGVNWELHPDNPVFRVGEAGSFDSIWVVQPSVIKRGHSYEMWYGASYQKEFDTSAEGMKALKTYLGRATSADGIHWTRDPDNPILGPGISGSGSWEEDGVFMPTVILDGDTLRMWYVGVGRQGSWYPDLVRGFQYQIGYAEKEIENDEWGIFTARPALPAHRAGEFTLHIVDTQGNPVPRADVTIRQVRHEFIFGGQIPFWLIDPAHSDRGADQQAILRRADEMFEQVIPSAVTWGWVEPERGELDFSRYDYAAGWARDHDKRLLLQHIFWGWNDDTHELSPAWLDGLDEAELRAALSQHIADVQANVGQIDGIVALNESLYQNIYNDRLGEDITYALFAAARQAFPDADLFINEFPWMPEDGSIEFGDLQTPIENYIAYVQRLDQNGVDFDRVGLQIYIGQDDVAAFGGIESLVAEVDARINQFTAETGRSLTITEFGLTAPDHALRAEYLGAFMRMAFANPNVDGFQVFHWLNEQVPDNALVLADGSLTQAGQVYYHLVLDEWTTRYQARTNDLGEINFSGIYGEYEIIVRHDNEEYTFTVDLSRDSPGEVELTLESVIGENYDG